MMELYSTHIWLNFISSFAWPTVLLIIIFMFKKQLEKLLSRLRSGEVAGAKFSFSEAASGLLQSKVDLIVEEQDKDKRAILAGEVKGIAEAIGAIHPISLSLLIQAGNGHSAWVGGAYTNKKQYFEELQRLDLAELIEESPHNGGLKASLVVLPKGEKILKKIGFYN